MLKLFAIDKEEIKFSELILSLVEAFLSLLFGVVYTIYYISLPVCIDPYIAYTSFQKRQTAQILFLPITLNTMFM